MRTGKTKVTMQSWAFSACLCFAVGIGAGIVGSVLTSLSWIIGTEVHPWVRGIGTALLILTIPLLILAGHCLDRLERTTEAKHPPYPEPEMHRATKRGFQASWLKKSNNRIKN